MLLSLFFFDPPPRPSPAITGPHRRFQILSRVSFFFPSPCSARIICLFPTFHGANGGRNCPLLLPGQGVSKHIRATHSHKKNRNSEFDIGCFSKNVFAFRHPVFLVQKNSGESPRVPQNAFPSSPPLYVTCVKFDTVLTNLGSGGRRGPHETFSAY